jgi:uncharacterized YigZ family protein
VDEYLTITQEIGEGLYSEKRSKFLAFACHVESVDDASTIIAKYRDKYYDARHCCYAYVIGPERDVFRANDDGEPSSTAGKPILGQINSRGLTDVLVVVVRYFGGVKLGPSGLIKAYKTAAAEALDHAKTEKRYVEEDVEYSFTYPMISKVMRVVQDMNAQIVKQQFDNTCSILLRIRSSKADELRRRLEHLNFE